MSPDEKKLALYKLEQAFAKRRLYRGVYVNDNAIVTIAEMMNAAGYYSTNPDTINPVLIAHVNQLLNDIGAVQPGHEFIFAKAIVSIADDEDLRAQRAAIEAAEED